MLANAEFSLTSKSEKEFNFPPGAISIHSSPCP